MMKYTSTQSECYSPKSPEVVLLCPLDVIFDKMDSTRLKYVPDTTADTVSESKDSGYIYNECGENNNESSTDNDTEIRIPPSPQHEYNFYRIRTRKDHEYSYCDPEAHRIKKSRSTGLYVPKPLCAVLTLFLLCMTACTFALMFVLWGQYNELRRELRDSHVTRTLEQRDSTSVCLPCNELLQGPFDEENPELQKLIRRRENNTEVCCAKTSAQISTLLNLFANNTQLKKCASDSSHSTHGGKCNSTSHIVPAIPEKVVSAHVYADPQPIYTDDIEEQPIKNWITNRPGAHLQGLKLSKNRLVVPEDGIYFVYSQAGFLIYYDNDHEPQNTQSIFHKLFRYQVIYPLDGSQELLRSEITQCWEQDKKYGRYTSYIGGSMELKKGDELYITVSRISKLSSKNEINYFGLYKIR